MPAWQLHTSRSHPSHSIALLERSSLTLLWHELVRDGRLVMKQLIHQATKQLRQRQPEGHDDMAQLEAPAMHSFTPSRHMDYFPLVAALLQPHMQPGYSLSPWANLAKSCAAGTPATPAAPAQTCMMNMSQPASPWPAAAAVKVAAVQALLRPEPQPSQPPAHVPALIPHSQHTAEGLDGMACLLLSLWAVAAYFYPTRALHKLGQWARGRTWQCYEAMVEEEEWQLLVSATGGGG